LRYAAVTTPNTKLGPLIQLAHHRWNITIIAELYRLQGAKFVTLYQSLGISKAVLSASLQALIDLDLVIKNSGHGHPMRPEYLLTPSGQLIGEQCLSLVGLMRKRDETDLAFRKWTLPLVAAIGGKMRRFNEVKGTLQDASPRAITLGLKSLIVCEWANRTIIDDYPPTAGYALLPKGRSVLLRIDSLYQIS